MREITGVSISAMSPNFPLELSADRYQPSVEFLQKVQSVYHIFKKKKIIKYIFNGSVSFPRSIIMFYSLTMTRNLQQKLLFYSFFPVARRMPQSVHSRLAPSDPFPGTGDESLRP